MEEGGGEEGSEGGSAEHIVLLIEVTVEENSEIGSQELSKKIDAYSIIIWFNVSHAITHTRIFDFYPEEDNVLRIMIVPLQWN